MSITAYHPRATTGYGDVFADVMEHPAGYYGLVGKFDWLQVGDFWNEYSQFGEDGLIDAVFRRIGTKYRWCFEIGAGDGETLSNVRRLILDNWNAILIEGDREKFDKLAATYNGDMRVRGVCQVVQPDGLDRVLRPRRGGMGFDLGVIDIDGQEFWMWAGLQECRPRVMLIEFALHFDNPELSADYLPRYLEQDQVKQLQASFERIVDLGCAKGYELVGHTLCNALFVRKDELR